MKKKIRVVQYGVGPIGASIVRLMRHKSSLEIVGAIDKDPAKAGHDLGEVVGAAAFALGRITSMADPSGSETYTYDKAGRILQLQKVIGTTTYTTGYTYNAGSELTQITYPSGRIVEQSFDNIGQLCEVAPVTSGCGSAPNPYITAYKYDATGNVLSFNYGNGVAASLGYSTNRSQLTSLTYAKSGSTLFGLNYYYQHDPTYCTTGTSSDNGTIECANDITNSSSDPGASGRDISYTYDALGRLASAKTTGSTQYPQWGLSWTYDRFGNRWTQSVTAGSAPAVSLAFGPNGMNSSTTNQPNGYTYDANGNMTVEALAPPNDLSYDDENRLIGFSGGAGSGTYVYDDNSDRVQKTANGTTTVYIYSGDKEIAEYDNGAAPSSPSREFIYADGGSGAQLLARITGTTTNYYHQDHLGVRLMTDSNGNDILNEGTYPFGESWYSNSLSNGEWVFTTYQHDTESGLDYALARFYDSRMGSFCSADPVGGDPTDPQTWNRYAYARNNPVNFIDPNGQSWVTALLDVLALVMQSFGLPTGEVALGQVADTAVNLGAFGADVRIMYSLGEQGQQKTQQPAPVPAPPSGGTSKPVYCDPSVMTAIHLAWDKQNPKNMLKANSDEAGFPAYKTPQGTYQAGNGPAGAPPQIQEGSPNGFRINITDPSKLAAVFHTHPRDTSGLPSTPSNTAGESGDVSDTASAVKNGTDIYVISDQGLSEAPASGPRNPKYGKNNSPWVVQGNGIDKWFPMLKKKCSQ